LNMGPPNCKSNALTALPRCLHVYKENKMIGCIYVWVKVMRVVIRRWKYKKTAVSKGKSLLSKKVSLMDEC